MSPSEYNARWEKALREIQTKQGETIVKIAKDALYYMKTRVVEEGKDAKGGTFPGYSTKPMLVGDKSFKKQDSKGFFRRDDLEWRSVLKDKGKGKPAKGQHYSKSDYWRLALLEGGYKELREIALGREFGDRVNFSFTSEMWGDIHLLSNVAYHDHAIAVIGALRDSEKKKLTYNTERNKRLGGEEILDLSENEIDTLKELHKQSFLNVIKNNGLE